MDAAALEDWVGRFVQTSLADAAVERFVEVVDAEIVRTLPEVAADPVLAGDLHRSTRHQWLSFLASLRRSEHELALPPQALDLARSIARRGLEVRVLLRVYLNAHHGVFEYISQAVEQVEDGPVPREEGLRTVWRRADLWMDESIEALIETFYEERQRDLAGSAARRAELVDAIIEGTDVDAAEASTTLIHPLHHWQTAFMVWSDVVHRHTPSMLQRAAEDLAGAFSGAALLTQLSGSRDLRCWVATPSQPTEETLGRLGPSRHEGVSVAVGRPALGCAGFRVSHLDARAAQHLAVQAELAPRFTDYREVELLCIALADRDALTRMASREVGPLCLADKNLAPVRETVLAFLRNRMNVEATAERLFVHGNTVRYRLAKAEELLGVQLADRSRHVELALQYVAYFGPPPD
jgi:PucR C-terminal helix-turn-helix domain/GGDEF-like domain